ncbi:putative ankyrin repeat protein [Tupanvirus soda lake]|uniref:Ankyrin repeat protein n=2 Tax=Tupanvirus TaxID=2094720 RepID=A0AC62AC48_9VIRU|nr:putative ankyrin repeat protein [Tupanvirus soda lake]QKU35357.1 putative ankyrin repeat protein [Tupanvirus soda lake]
MMDYSEIDNIIITDKNEANKYFLDLCLYTRNLDVIKYMVDSGIDPRQSDDQAFVNACVINDFNIISYLVNHCGANVNAQNGKGLKNLMGHFSENSIKFMIDNGAIVTDVVIFEAIQESDIISLQALIKYGIDPNQISRVYWNYMSIHSSFDIKIMNCFIKNNVDLNQSLTLFLKNKN